MTEQGLHRLLLRAGIASSARWRAIWFDDCRLHKNVVLCPDIACCERMERLFGDDLRRVVSDLEFRTEIGLTAEELPKVPPSVLKKSTPQKFWSS